MKINNFWGDLTDGSAKTEAFMTTFMVRQSCNMCDVRNMRELVILFSKN